MCNQEWLDAYSRATTAQSVWTSQWNNVSYKSPAKHFNSNQMTARSVPGQCSKISKSSYLSDLVTSNKQILFCNSFLVGWLAGLLTSG